MDSKINNVREKNEEYHILYKMMMQALKSDNIATGIKLSLSTLQGALECSDITIHVKNEDGLYEYYASQENMNNLVTSITCIVNKTANLVEKKERIQIDMDLSENFQNMNLVHIKTENKDYILTINNFEIEFKNMPKLIGMLKDTLIVILHRAELYERNTRAINTDLLTGLDNRNSYEKRIQGITTVDKELVFGLFDLFRLKYINDQYSHSLGDEYIKKTAKILNKYWPKYTVLTKDDGSKEQIETGHCVYRIGGDEFALLTTKEQLKLAIIKADLAAKEVETIDLSIDENTKLGLNYGFLVHDYNDSMKETYIKADNLMSQDKEKMYKKYGIERRR